MKQATQLANRILWYDGDSTIPADQIADMVSAGIATSYMFVEELTSDIKKFNRFVSDDQKITVKGSVREMDFSWTVPQEYQDLDVDSFVIDRMYAELKQHQTPADWFAQDGEASQEIKEYIARVVDELNLYRTQGLHDILRTLIYIINTLQSNDIVWGVGRGSSVSSYILYLIGVHDVDSVKYELDITDFLRSGE